MRRSLSYLFLFLIFSSALNARALKARRALVAVDGAAIYEKPSFDSPVVTYLNAGELVVASVKTFQGIGGIGLFFALKTKSGVKGFIADTDLVSAQTKKPLSPLMKDRDPVRVDRKDLEKSFGEPKEPLYFTRYLGLSFGKKGYSKKYAGRTYSSDMMFFGLRSTGPGTLFDGPPLDFNLLVSVDSPDFYTEFASNKPSGYLAYSDLLLQLPFWDKDNHLVYYGFGFMMSYSSYSVKISTQTKDETEFRLGGELGLGYAYRFMKSYVVRADYKYHFEKHQNSSYWLSVMTEY